MYWLTAKKIRTPWDAIWQFKMDFTFRSSKLKMYLTPKLIDRIILNVFNAVVVTEVDIKN